MLETEVNGNAALEIWRQLSFPYPLHWMALWPLIGLTLAQGRTSEAIEHARALLDSKQKRLPDNLTTILDHAIRLWDRGEKNGVPRQLSQALELAQELKHF